MNDMSSKEIQQPKANLSVEGIKHISAVENALGYRSKGLVAEKLTQFLKIVRQKPLLTAAGLLSIGYAGCNNVEQQNVPPPIPPPPATYELPTGMPSSTIEFTKTPMPAIVEQKKPTTEAPMPPPTIEKQVPIPTPELSPRETVVQLKKEIQAESSKIMDNMEKDAQEIGYFFINIGGEKTPEGEDHRVFLLPIPIKDYYSVGSNDRNRYVLITSEGLKTFSPTPVQKHPTENIYDEQVIRDFFIPYLEYFQGRLIESINVAADLGTTPKDPFQFALSKETEPPRFPFSQGIVFSPRDIITYTDFEGEKTEGITTLYIPPINDKVKEVIEESKKMTEELTHGRIDKYRRRLEDTKDLSKTLQGPSLSSPQPSPPPTQPPK